MSELYDLVWSNDQLMDSIYYFAVIFTIGLSAFGVFCIAVAGYQLARGADLKNVPYSRPLILSRFLSGVANLLIGVTLYWHVNETMTSTILVMLAMSAFTFWEWFVRTNFIEPTD